MTHNVSSRRTTPRLAPRRQHCAKAADILCRSLSPQDQQDDPAAVLAYGRWYDTATTGALRAEADGQCSDPLADVATVMAILHSAVTNGWLFADELDAARAYLSETAASGFVKGILAGVAARPRPVPEDVRSSSAP